MMRHRAGKTGQHGRRFHHITGRNDKALAVDILIKFYERAFGPVDMIGLGDTPNDIPFLQRLDHPYVMSSDSTGELRRAVPGAILTAQPGPGGWQEAILSSLA